MYVSTKFFLVLFPIESSDDSSVTEIIVKEIDYSKLDGKTVSYKCTNDDGCWLKLVEKSLAKYCNKLVT